MVAAVIAFGVTDTDKADAKHAQGTPQDLAHATGLRKPSVHTVVIGSELGTQVSVKDPNRIVVLGSHNIPEAA